MLSKVHYGTKRLSTTGTSKTLVIPARYRHELGNPEFFNVESIDGTLIIKPHKE